MTNLHSTQTAIHIIHNWTYADASARTGASGFVAADVGKAAKQTDTNEWYLLVDTAPTWRLIGVGAQVGRRSVDHTSDTTWYTVYLDGLSTGFPIPSDTAWAGHALIIGLTAGATQRWAYSIKDIAIVNDGGTTTLLSAGTLTTISESDAAYEAQAVGNDTDDSLDIQVRRNGGSAYTVDWVVRLDIAEVTNA